MARVQGEFRWSILPTLATYCVYRIEENKKSKFHDLRNEIVLRFGMPKNGLDRKIDSNFPEALSIYNGTYSGPQHCNHHDKSVLSSFHNYSLKELIEIYDEIVNLDLSKYEDRLIKIAVEILKKCPQQKEMYFDLTIAQGLDVSKFKEEIFGKKSKDTEVENEISDEDSKYVEQVNKIGNINEYTEEEINLLSKRIPKKHTGGVAKYQRNPIIARYALEKAKYKCEVDPSHDTFLKRTDGKPYLEPHHIIPISKQGDYEYGLDSLDNIAVLCPNCHRAIHFASKEHVESLLEKIRKNKRI